MKASTEARGRLQDKGKPKPKRVDTSGTAKARKATTGSPIPMKGGDAQTVENSATRSIEKQIRAVGGWRGETLARIRALILDADPDMVEERKWVKPTNPSGVPVWSHAGIVCTGEVYSKIVKLTFARGAALPDPKGLFNSSLEGSTRRAIDIHEGEKVDARAFEALILAAVAHNELSAKKR